MEAGAWSSRFAFWKPGFVDSAARGTIPGHTPSLPKPGCVLPRFTSRFEAKPVILAFKSTWLSYWKQFQ